MIEYEVRGVKIKAQTKPDLFSPKGLDRGSRLLMECVPQFEFQKALDWGCGWGAIGLWLAASFTKAHITALDSDIGAIKTINFNKKLNQLDNLDVVLSYSYEDLPRKAKFDLICVNPPTHRGRGVVEELIKQSRERLNPGGHLLVVVETRLKTWVSRTMKQVFGNYKILKRGPKNVVLLASI